MKLIAHRGIHNGNVHENSLKSITSALEDDKYAGVEFDVRMTRDKKIVIFHDAYYNDILIRNTNYCDLPKFVPKLEDVLKINSDKIFLIEVKYLGSELDEFIKLIEKYPEKNFYVTSFNSKLMEHIAEDKKRSFKVGILNYVLNSTELDKLDFICVIDSLIDNKLYNLLKKKNKEIFAYGILKKANIGKYKDIYYIVDDIT